MLAVWISTATFVCALIAFLAVYRKLSSTQKQLTEIREQNTTPSELQSQTQPIMNALQGVLLDISKVQGTASQALGKITDASLNSWNTFEKGMAFATEEAKKTAATIENGNRELSGTLRTFENLAKSLDSTSKFLESQAEDVRREHIYTRDRLQSLSEHLASGQKSMCGGFDEIRVRAINDQLTAYPRRLVIVQDERELDLDPVQQRPGLWLMRGRCDRVRFRLLCEHEACQWQGGTSRYKSSFIYEVREPARIDWTYLPRSGDVEAFCDLADISGVTDKMKDVGTKILVEAGKKAMLSVSVTLAIGQHADPLVATAIIICQAGLEHVVDRLHADFKDREATKELWQLIVNNCPYEVKDIGGPAHIQFGEFIRQKEEEDDRHLHKRFGGLSKWMNPDTNTFEWVCSTDAYSMVAKYRADAVRSERPSTTA